jgi:hypothetical protein
MARLALPRRRARPAAAALRRLQPQAPLRRSPARHRRPADDLCTAQPRGIRAIAVNSCCSNRGSASEELDGCAASLSQPPSRGTRGDCDPAHAFREPPLRPCAGDLRRTAQCTVIGVMSS